MKSILYSLLAVLIVSGVIYGAGELVQPKTGNTPSQMFATDGRSTISTTKFSNTKNLSTFVHMAFYPMTTCQVRYLPSTSKTYLLYNRGFNNLSTTQYAYPKSTYIGGSWIYRGINNNTPYVNFSGCKSGTVEVQ